MAQNTIRIASHLSDVATIDHSAEVSPHEVGLSESTVSDIWQKIKDAYKTAVYPGITFSLRRHNKIVMQRAIGHATGNGPDDNERTIKKLTTANTPVCLFSTSKAITATIMHILHEKGSLDINGRVSDYIPEFAQNGKKDITISDVLSHRAGFSGFTRAGMTDRIFEFDYVVQTLCEQKAEIHTKGNIAYHAVTGGFILGEIVKRATGSDIRVALDNLIRKPLGFEYFNYGAPGVPREIIAENYATGMHDLFLFSKLVEYSLGSSIQTIVNLAKDQRFFDGIIPSVNMVATAPEVSLFFQTLLNGGRLGDVRICKEETVQMMTRETGYTWFDRRLMMPMRYSNGLMLGNEPQGLYGPKTKQAFGHIGFLNILCWADPERDIAVSFLNTGKSLGGPHLIAFANVIRAISDGCL